MLLLALKRQDFLQIFCLKTVLNKSGSGSETGTVTGA
jgi:hypothetical protein